MSCGCGTCQAVDDEPSQARRAGQADEDLHARRRRGPDEPRRRLARLEARPSRRGIRNRRRAELARRSRARTPRPRPEHPPTDRADPERALRRRRGSVGAVRPGLPAPSRDPGPGRRARTALRRAQRTTAGSQELRAARRERGRGTPPRGARSLPPRRARRPRRSARGRARSARARLPEPTLRSALHPRPRRERRGRGAALEAGRLAERQPSLRASSVEPARVVDVRVAAAALLAKRNCTVPLAVGRSIMSSSNTRGVLAPSVPSPTAAAKAVAAAKRIPVESWSASAVELSPMYRK